MCFCELFSYISDGDDNFVTRVGHLHEDWELKDYAKEFENLRQPPSVCLLADSGEVMSLTEQFMPSFLMGPAWSSSVHSFQRRFEPSYRTIHTIFLLCNCCNTVHDSEPLDIQGTVTGMLCMPVKSTGHMEPAILPVRRPPDCAKVCGVQGGCIVMIEIDFFLGSP